MIEQTKNPALVTAWRYWLVLLPCCVLGCSRLTADQQHALREGESFEVYSLSPEPKNFTEEPNFNRWKILGKTTVSDRSVRNSLIAALKKDASALFVSAAKCFDPRHGVRVTHNGKTYDFVICFQCSQMWIYVDGEERGEVYLTKTAEPIFDKVLTNAGVPLEPKAESAND